jgi:hypothetical protein
VGAAGLSAAAVLASLADETPGRHALAAAKDRRLLGRSS